MNYKVLVTGLLLGSIMGAFIGVSDQSFSPWIVIGVVAGVVGEFMWSAMRAPKA